MRGQSFAVPTPRYGHSMVYDSRHQQLVIIGGYDHERKSARSTGAIAGTYTIPDMWTATRTRPSARPAICGLRSTRSETPMLGGIGSLQNLGLAHIVRSIRSGIGLQLGLLLDFRQRLRRRRPDREPDPNISKLLAGGVYFDIDRTQLGRDGKPAPEPHFLASGPGRITRRTPHRFRPRTKPFSASISCKPVRAKAAPERFPTALSRIHRQQQLSGNRSRVFPSSTPPTGQPRTEQIVIPLSANSNIDRIRIERYSGTAILIDASLFRMGQK